MTPIILVELFGVEKLCNAFGFAVFFYGLGALAGPPFAGRYMTVYDFNLPADLTDVGQLF